MMKRVQFVLVAAFVTSLSSPVFSQSVLDRIGGAAADVVQDTKDAAESSIDAAKSLLGDKPAAQPAPIVIDDTAEEATNSKPPALGLTGDNAQAGGVAVVAVDKGSVAEAAGLREGDVILDFNGKPTKTMDDLADQLKQIQHGQSVALRVQRLGLALTLNAQFGAAANANSNASGSYKFSDLTPPSPNTDSPVAPDSNKSPLGRPLLPPADSNNNSQNTTGEFRPTVPLTPAPAAPLPDHLVPVAPLTAQPDAAPTAQPPGQPLDAPLPKNPPLGGQPSSSSPLEAVPKAETEVLPAPFPDRKPLLSDPDATDSSLDPDAATSSATTPSTPGQSPASLGVTVTSASGNRGVPLAASRGAFITAIRPGGTAATYGLPIGAVITRFDNTRITGPQDLIDAVGKSAVGQTVELSYYNGRQLFRKQIKLGPAPTQLNTPPNSTQNLLGQTGRRPLLGELERPNDPLRSRTVVPPPSLSGRSLQESATSSAELNGVSASRETEIELQVLRDEVQRLNQTVRMLNERLNALERQRLR